jgi:hypothetical protein
MLYLCYLRNFFIGTIICMSYHLRRNYPGPDSSEWTICIVLSRYKMKLSRIPYPLQKLSCDVLPQEFVQSHLYPTGTLWISISSIHILSFLRFTSQKISGFRFRLQPGIFCLIFTSLKPFLWSCLPALHTYLSRFPFPSFTAHTLLLVPIERGTL